VLNGFPIVNYGLETRELFRSAGVPIHISGNVDEEAMLSSGNGLRRRRIRVTSRIHWHDLVQHSRDYPLVQRIQNNQYVSRLAAHYTEGGAPIELIALGELSGPRAPRSRYRVGDTVDALIGGPRREVIFLFTAVSKVRFEQDVAAFHAYRRVADHYLALFEHEDVDCVTHSWPWMGAWPEPSISRTAALVSCARLCRCWQASIILT